MILYFQCQKKYHMRMCRIWKCKYECVCESVFIHTIDISGKMCVLNTIKYVKIITSLRRLSHRLRNEIIINMRVCEKGFYLFWEIDFFSSTGAWDSTTNQTK